jgi:hypothetical protein
VRSSHAFRPAPPTAGVDCEQRRPDLPELEGGGRSVVARAQHGQRVVAALRNQALEDLGDQHRVGARCKALQLPCSSKVRQEMDDERVDGIQGINPAPTPHLQRQRARTPRP